MLDHPFRTLGMIAGLLFAGLIGWAVTIGGYSLEDPELEAQGAWVRSFKQDNPELAREIGPQSSRTSAARHGPATAQAPCSAASVRRAMRAATSTNDLPHAVVAGPSWL